MSNNDKPIANSSLVFREENDNWGVLYDPDSGSAFGLSPVSAFIWQRLDGRHSSNEITLELRKKCRDMPDNAEFYIENFIQDLIKRGFVGYET